MSATQIPAAQQLSADTAGLTSPAHQVTNTIGLVPQELTHFVTDAGELGSLLFGHTIGQVASTAVPVTGSLRSELGGLIPHWMHMSPAATPTVEGVSEEPGGIPQTITFLDTVKGEWNKLRTSLGI